MSTGSHRKVIRNTTVWTSEIRVKKGPKRWVDFLKQPDTPHVESSVSDFQQHYVSDSKTTITIRFTMHISDLSPRSIIPCTGRQILRHKAVQSRLRYFQFYKIPQIIYVENESASDST